MVETDLVRSIRPAHWRVTFPCVSVYVRRVVLRDFALDSKIRMFKPQEDRPFQTLDPMQSTTSSFCARTTTK